MRRVTWTLISSYASVVGVEGHRLLLGFSNAQMRENFDNGTHPELVRQAIIEVLGADLRVEAIVDPAATNDSALLGGREVQAQSAATVPLPQPPPEEVDGWGPSPAVTGAADADPAAHAVPATDGARDGDQNAASDEDDDLDGDLTGAALLKRELGASVLSEDARG
jgi:DNA polymerase-3 subunit gamma/tau